MHFTLDSKPLIVSFIFPRTNGKLGGVQMLVVNLICHFTHFTSIKVRLYDYTNGVIHNELQKRKIANYEFIPLDKTIMIPNKGGEVFFLTSTLYLYYPLFFKKKRNVYLFIYDVYSPSWQSFAHYIRKVFPKFKTYTLSKLVKNQAIAFMDQKGQSFFESNGFDVSIERIIPIPITVRENSYLRKASKAIISKTNILYIGRGVDWKIQPVKLLLDDLMGLENQFNLIIITNDVACFKKALSDYGQFDIQYFDQLSGVELDEFIMKHADIGYAMGTAALEIAKLGVPTILADYTNTGSYIKPYYYRWLHENKMPGVLGVNLANEYNNGTWTIDDMLKYYEKSRLFLSKLSFNYVRNNHSINLVSEKFIDALKKTTLKPYFLFSPLFIIMPMKRYIQRVFCKVFHKNRTLW